MGVSSSKPQNKNIYYDTQFKGDGKSFLNKPNEENDLKIILFLMIQLKELREIKVTNEPINFYIIKETLKKYQENYNIKEISDYMNSFIKNMNLKEHIDWNKIAKEVKEFKKIKINSGSPKENINIPLDIKYNKSNNIKYITNFSLIETQFISEFNNFLNQNDSNITPEKKIGYIIHIQSKNEKDEIIDTTYIILNDYNQNENDIYLGICLEEFDFKIDYLFIVEQNINKETFINIAKENIEKTKNETIEKNRILKISEGIDMIYNPENMGNNDYITNEKIYNKISYYFSIDKMYNQFISSFKDIRNHKLKDNEIDINHIEQLILKQKLILQENLVYLFDENNLKNNILDDIFYYYQYNLYASGNDNEKKILIENIFEKEDYIKNDNDENRIKYFMKFLSYNDICNNNTNIKISLINAEIYQRIQGLFNEKVNNYVNIETNLIKINNELYIYFNKVKRFGKLIGYGKKKEKPLHDKNIWSLVLMN